MFKVIKAPDKPMDTPCYGVIRLNRAQPGC